MSERLGKMRVSTAGAEIELVRAGSGPPLLLLHGYPQMHVMWHKVAPRLSEEFTVVAPDLRGYGDSSKPAGGEGHANYSKREMARDQVEVMSQLGFDEFHVAGHDRGGRVAHRMALDHPERIQKLAVLDIAPTHTMYTTADMEFARAYYHWFFLIQPYDLPERMIGADPKYYLRKKLGQWGHDEGAITPEAFEQYLRCMTAEMIHASCEDYRASASIDLEHDEEDLYSKILCPMLVLWGGHGFVGHKYDVLGTWREKAHDVQGHALPCGHFLPEEAPDETLKALRTFFSR